MSDDRSIAVIGMGLRAPGAANTEEFWQSLIQGKESISRLSDDDVIAAHGDPAVLSNPDLVRAAGILDGIEKFDAAYFGYTPREAEIMDPQQRFLLEVAVEALEDAGCDPTSSKSTTGVFLGIGRSGYFLHHLLPRTDLMTLFARQISLFNDKDFAATQISHRLNLTGPEHDDRHGVLHLAGLGPSGVQEPPRVRMRRGARRWGDDQRPSARRLPVPGREHLLSRWSLPCVRRGGAWHRRWQWRRTRGVEAVVGCGA
ncbi:hypothetical protein BF14_005745 [Streptomyces griseus]|nr:polyketide synthase [Streptomyces globisporus]PPA39295.1 hypothetical protein BF14_005745 [Streptomyces griseus]